jgi:hypothetical protein
MTFGYAAQFSALKPAWLGVRDDRVETKATIQLARKERCSAW